MSAERRCAHCREPLPPGSQLTRRYCSRRCRWAAHDRAKIAARSAVRAQARAERERWTCPMCPRPIGPLPPGSRRRYCSAACAATAHKLARAERDWWTQPKTAAAQEK